MPIASICSFSNAASSRNVKISSAAEALFSLARTHCIQKTSQSRPQCGILLWDLITDWQLSFFSVFKIMPKTAFFACIFSCVLLSWQDLFVVIHARPAHNLLRFPCPCAARSIPSRGRKSHPSASYPLDTAGFQFPRWRPTWPAPGRVGTARAIELSCMVEVFV